MPVFENKKDMIEFLEYITKEFKTRLSDNTAYDVSLNLVALAKDDMDAIVDTFNTFITTHQAMIQPAKGVIKK